MTADENEKPASMRNDCELKFRVRNGELLLLSAKIAISKTGAHAVGRRQSSRSRGRTAPALHLGNLHRQIWTAQQIRQIAQQVLAVHQDVPLSPSNSRIHVASPEGTLFVHPIRPSVINRPLFTLFL